MDQRKKYEEAIEAYTKSIEYLMTARRFNKNPAMRKLYGGKIAQWLERAEKLKKLQKENEAKAEEDALKKLEEGPSPPNVTPAPPPEVKVQVDPMTEAEATLSLANTKEKQKEFSEALDLYMKGIEYMLQILRASKEKAVKAVLKQKVAKYMKAA